MHVRLHLDMRPSCCNVKGWQQAVSPNTVASEDSMEVDTLYHGNNKVERNKNSNPYRIPFMYHINSPCRRNRHLTLGVSSTKTSSVSRRCLFRRIKTRLGNGRPHAVNYAVVSVASRKHRPDTLDARELHLPFNAHRLYVYKWHGTFLLPGNGLSLFHITCHDVLS